jgi:hypothetical protein
MQVAKDKYKSRKTQGTTKTNENSMVRILAKQVIHIQRISIVAPFVLNEPMVIWLKMTQWKAK